MSIEKEIKVETILVRKYCDCGGEMIPNGGVLSTYPPSYSHDCDKCGYRECYSERYPIIKYIEK